MADDQLSRVFAALADPTRRDIVARLSVGDATVGELAEPYRKGLMGSSTMPHKVNPGKCEWLISIARIVRHNAGVSTLIWTVRRPFRALAKRRAA